MCTKKEKCEWCVRKKEKIMMARDEHNAQERG